MKRQIARRAITAIVLIAAITVGAMWMPRLWAHWFPEEKKESFIPTAVAKSGELVVSVKELGNIQAEQSISVSSEIDGKIIYIIPEGKTAQPGDLLIQLDDTPLKNEYQASKLAYANQQALVEKAKLETAILKESNRNEVEQQEAQINYDKAELQRLRAQLEKKKRLAGDKLIPQSEVEMAEIEVKRQEFAVEKGEKTLGLKRKEVENRESQKDSDVRSVEFAAMMAKSKLQESESRLSKARIVSRGSGLVVIEKQWMGDSVRKFKVGDQVFPRWRLLQIPDLSSMQALVQVDEADIARVAAGQRVRLTLDALPGKRFSGVVKEISTLASESSPWESSSGKPGRKSFEVVVQIDRAGATPLRPGMTANAEIISDRIAKCVYVPLEAIFERDGKRFAYVKSGGVFSPVAVKVGKSNESFVAVELGLAPGAVVALRDPTKSETGVPVSTEKSAPVAKPVPAPAEKS